MNHAKEKFPECFDSLIQKCNDAMVEIEKRFSKENCPSIKDLFLEGSKITRQSDFMEKLEVKKCTVKSSEKHKKNNEIKGLYIFGEQNNFGKIIPIYIGISRSVFKRLKQHAWGKNHNQASLCYLKAKYDVDQPFEGKREEMPIELLIGKQKKLGDYKVIVIPEMNDYDLYFMEVYLAGRLKTKWNSFRTH